VHSDVECIVMLSYGDNFSMKS